MRFRRSRPKHYNCKKAQHKLRGGFKLNEVNLIGNSGAYIAACIECCSTNPCPAPNVNDDVSIVTKIFPSTAEGFRQYTEEIAFGPLLRRFDPLQARYVYNLQKDCVACQDVPLSALEPRVRNLLKRVNREATDDTSLSSFYMYNMPALNPYRNISTISEARKDFLRESVRFLHLNGITHNDLHKDNILESPDGNPRIIDFGMSTSFNTQAPTEEDEQKKRRDFQMLERTLARAPPELPRGRGRRSFPDPDRSRSRSRSRSPPRRDRSRSLSPSRLARLASPRQYHSPPRK